MRRYRRRNPTDVYTPVLVGVGVVAILAIGYVVVSSTSASASTPNSFGPAQFAGGGSGAQGALGPGAYVSLRDMPSGTNILAQVGGVSGDAATGTVAYAPGAANESVGDVVSFNLSDVVASSAAPFAP